MSAYDLARIQREIDDLPKPSTNTTAKGKKLQNLVHYMLDRVDGATVVRSNVYNAAQSEEKDLWFRHLPYVSGLPFADFLVPVECKNEDEPVSADEVTRFEAKIRNSGGSDGLLVSRGGLSGSSEFKAAHDAIHSALSRQIRIVVLTVDDLTRVPSPDVFVDLLVDRHSELRVLQTYKSI